MFRSFLITFFTFFSLQVFADDAVDLMVDLDEIPRPRLNFVNPFFSTKGYILGEVGTIRNEGFPIWRYRYEGSLMQGIGNIPGPIIDNGCEEQRQSILVDRWMRGVNSKNEGLGVEVDGSFSENPCELGHNPLPFSFFSRRTAKKILYLRTGLEVFYFVRPTIAPQAVLTRTRNFIGDVWPIDRSIELEESISSRGLPVSRVVTRERGVVSGRVILATVENVVFKTYEIIIQSVAQGNEFKALSVHDPRVFDYLVDSMFAGRRVKIEFVRIAPGTGMFSDLRGRWTHFRIVKVDLLD